MCKDDARTLKSIAINGLSVRTAISRGAIGNRPSQRGDSRFAETFQHIDFSDESGVVAERQGGREQAYFVSALASLFVSDLNEAASMPWRCRSL